MINSTFNPPQMVGMQKHNRVINANMPPQQQPNPHQTHQLQRNMSIVENSDLLPSSTQTNGMNYLHHQQPLMCSSSQLNHQQAIANSFHANHSLVTTMGNAHMPSLSTTSNAIFDPRLGRLYSTAGNNVVSQLNSTGEYINNDLNTISNMPNTILINNFAQQLQTDQPAQQLYQHHSIHSSTQPTFQNNFSANVQQIQHSSSATLQQAQQQNHQAHQPQSQQQQQQYFCQPQVTNAVSSTSSQTMQALHLPTTNQQFYVSADTFGTATDDKMSAYLPPPIVNSTLTTNLRNAHGQGHTHDQQQQLPIQMPTTTAATTSLLATTSSPVVLDRINICINNHYTDSGVIPINTVTNGTPSLGMPVDASPLPSPIIPAIQHSGAIDPALLVDALANSSEISSNTCTPTPIPIVIHEPDSTTTSNTPPTTPENTNPICMASILQSPSTSSTASDTLISVNKIFILNETNEIKSNGIETHKKTPAVCESYKNGNTNSMSNEDVDLPLTPLLSRSMEFSITTTPEVSFVIGEDVFIRKEDERLYLGTVIDSKYQKYRVRFDDKSEVWCTAREMRKFGNFGDTSVSPGDAPFDDVDAGTLCVACKVRDLTGVEVCERCGRGYHHECTTEKNPGHNDWLCKRCDKPLKMEASEIDEGLEILSKKRNFPYDIKSLTWDSKHRVNQEQIYCYCGKSGQFDHNMLQCCKCLNWFHTNCIQNFKLPMLRGDGNFIFCCSICSSDSTEFLRRLQINTVDYVHLVLYNLSAQRKHQQHKYHHLTKDIWPFILTRRHRTILPEEWHNLNEDVLKDCIATTLKANSDRFVCGREVKRDCYYYGLRNNGPPLPPKINIQKEDILCEELITKQLGLKLTNQDLEKERLEKASECNAVQKKNLSRSLDVYEFYSEKEDIDVEEDNNKDDDEKFTSDDEIPIKHILEKEKRKSLESVGELNLKKKPISSTAVEDKKDCQVRNIDNIQKSDEKLIKTNEKRNHKRKAFTLSKPYKETADAAAAKRYHSVRTCDSSSDDNSSSSRGTSLDLIIPPPKDFLGLNNPFRNVTPKKNSDKKVTPFVRCNGPGGPTIKNSIVNTSSLDFSSKLAALKSAGIFPNLNATSLAKAAGQPRMVRTIKRRLSAKDIMIGPNQEVRRRRTRRLSANVEVISTTTINPLPSNIFPLNAKDLFTSGSASNAPIQKQTIASNTASSSSSPSQSSLNLTSTTSSSLQFRAQFPSTTKMDEQTMSTVKLPAHGRRLRVRTQKPVTNNSRRSSLSGASTSSNSSSSCAAISTAVSSYPEPTTTTLNDLQQSVNKYFGIGNRIMAGEKFSVYAKRNLPNGHVQYLIEWGNEDGSTGSADSTTNVDAECALEVVEIAILEEKSNF